MSMHACARFKVEAYIATRNAQLGMLTVTGRLDLARAALAVPKEYVNVRNATLRFIEDVGVDPKAASDALDCFIDAWEAFEFPSKTDPAAEQVHDWQARKDCGHG